MVGLAVILVMLGVGLFMFLPSAEQKAPSPSQVNKMFTGLPQQGDTLGSDRAPVVVTVFSDTQCPACRNFALYNLPRIVDKFVRPGQAQLRLVPIAIRGPSSSLGAKASYAAGRYNRMWQFNSLLMLEQRADGLSEESITQAAASAGLKPRTLLAQIPGQDTLFERGVAEARAQGVSKTPTFLVASRGKGRPKVFVSSRTDSRDLDEFIQNLLGRPLP